ncbi:hypothetical protein ACQPZF_28280 [Actinosynnema sp. CS-041913]|uniref:hypothetical protein n=1 Tax=Actinosynnema sp. CS-041913 TaxID=3239917 RepID=UPI003D90D61E
MTSSDDASTDYTPPHDTGAPDSVETDPVALNSAEDLDEDRLKLDPLEAGMDPPEHWTGADKYGMTPYEQAHARPLDDRLAEEQPDPTAAPDVVPETGDEAERADTEVALEPSPDADEEALSEAVHRGQAADEPGGSVAASIRQPEDKP